MIWGAQSPREGHPPWNTAHLQSRMFSKLRADVFFWRGSRRRKDYGYFWGPWEGGGGRSGTWGTFTQLSKHQKKKNPKSYSDPSFSRTAVVLSKSWIYCVGVASALSGSFFCLYCIYWVMCLVCLSLTYRAQIKEKAYEGWGSDKAKLISRLAFQELNWIFQKYSSPQTI